MDSVSITSEKEICCCGARSWSMVIAWFQIVMSCVGICVSMFFLSIVEAKLPSHLKVYTIIGTVYALVSGVGLVMGVFLERGAKTGNLHYVRAYVINTIGTVFIAFNMNILMVFVTDVSPLFWLCVILFCIVIVVDSFCIWVVRIFMHELQEESRRSSSSEFVDF